METKINLYDYIFGRFERSSCDAHLKFKEDVIGWKAGHIIKKDKNGDDYSYPVIIKLLIPYDATRTYYADSSLEKYGKHRCERATVLGFYSYYTGKELKNLNEAYAFYGYHPSRCFIYLKGATVVPDDYRGEGGYFPGPWVCDGGIHFFYKKECAFAWMDYMADGYGVLRRKNNYLIRRQEYLKKLRGGT